RHRPGSPPRRRRRPMSFARWRPPSPLCWKTSWTTRPDPIRCPIRRSRRPAKAIWTPGRGGSALCLEAWWTTPPAPDLVPDPPLPPPGEGDLDPGTWRQLIVPSRSIYRPRMIGSQSIAEGQPGCAENVTPNPSMETGTMFRSFSGMTAGRGKVWSIGGGHAGHPGNDLDLLDITTAVWTQPFQTELPPPYDAGVPNATWRAIKGGGVGIGGLSPTNRPWVNHTYRLTAVDTTRDRLLWMSGNGFGAYAQDGTWTQLSGKDKLLNEPAATSAMGIIYDPERDSCWCFAGDNGNGLTRGIFEYSMATDTWRQVQNWPAVDGWGFSGKLIQAMYAPAHREAFLICQPSGGSIPAFPQRLFRYSLDTGELVWEQSRYPGTPQYEELYSGSPLRWGRHADFRTTSNQLYLYAFSTLTAPVTRGFWVFTPAIGSGGTWEKQETPDGPALAWWTLCYDQLTDNFVGLRARSTYCGVAGAACGGIADTHLFTF